MKHRGSGKLKLEHHIVPEARRWLEEIEDWPEIQGIIPGEIKRRRTTSKLVVRIQGRLETGIKCILKNQNLIQEIFITSNQTEELITRLQEHIKKSGVQ